ncbi:MAG: class I SAM-dependent RNA methyltransferase, partial [Betaproteobacteria bacterium]|nr:class I SAM-dependent RNA methyltransferase [Betaproteobacteria bacterium]
MEQFFASSPRGLESLLATELASLGAKHVVAVPGGVAFSGDWQVCYTANLWSRLASRILWRVAEFDYAGDDDLYEAARNVDWPRLFAVERTLRVNVSAHKSPLKSLDFATLRIKDAVCDRFRDALGSRPSVDRVNPQVRVHAFLESARGALYLDTSGELLFKRGWRAGAVDAPLRENLAAGILMLSGWKPEEPLLDPMCGGGTLLVEAAAMARGRAPGARREFGFEKLKIFDANLWKKVKGEDLKSSPTPSKLEIFGSDNDPRALNDARRNLAGAGVERWVKLEQADVLERAAPAAAGVMVANPPYGERIGSKEELALFYPKLGSALKRNFAGWRCHFFT